jgi:uncharacterized protein
MNRDPDTNSDVAVHQTSVCGTPWGLWPTIGFTLVLTIIWVVTQSVILAAFFIATLGQRAAPRGAAALPEQFEKLAFDGTVFSVTTLATALVIPCFCLLFAWLRPGITVKNYLGLHRVSFKRILAWIGVSLGMAALLDVITLLTGRPVVPKVMIDLYESVQFEPLLWLAVVVAAPIAEEFVFRGFLFVGLRHSLLGSTGTVLITSSVWATMHMQYDLFSIASIALVGVVLGIARIRTDSLLVPISMHALHNLIATIEVAVVVRQGL